MKTTTKFLVIFLSLTALFSAGLSAFTAWRLDIIRDNTNTAVNRIIVSVRRHYPDVSDDELAGILNSKSDVKSPDGFLQRYGIDSGSDWLVYGNEAQAAGFVAQSAALCSLVCLILTALFLLYSAKQKRRTAEITECIRQINKGDYSFSVESNSEDELSALKNEVYTTAVMLKEQSEKSLADKKNLKDSLSDISHQLKTPLASIRVILESVIDDEDMPVEIRRDFLSDIQRQSNNISFLVQSILTLSKLDANSIILKKRRERLSDIANKALKNTAVLAELKGVEVTARCDAVITLECDAKWLCEALTNIVKNCIEHTPRGGTVKLEIMQNSFYTRITVADNGCGISAGDLPHIFERFYKCENSGEDSAGIGLALAKTIVEKGGGFISAASTLGKGSEFNVIYFNTKH